MSTILLTHARTYWMHYHIYCLDNKARLNSTGQSLFKRTKIQEEATEVSAAFSDEIWEAVSFWEANKKTELFKIYWLTRNPSQMLLCAWQKNSNKGKMRKSILNKKCILKEVFENKTFPFFKFLFFFYSWGL